MNTSAVSSLFYLSPYVLILAAALAIEILLLRRLQYKKVFDDFLRTRGAQVTGSVIICQERGRGTNSFSC